MDKNKKPIAFCIKRGSKISMYNFYSSFPEYIYVTDTNELYLSYRNERIKVERYQDIDWTLLASTILYNRICTLVDYLPTICRDGELFHCLDSKELYIGNDSKPRLVLSLQ